MINQWYGLEELLEILDWLDEAIDKNYKIRSELVPVWKNFLKNNVDNFNRYPEMLDHGTIHICNVLNLLAEWIAPEYKRLKEQNKTEEENKENASLKILNSEELFILIGAIFLHDIGMSSLDYEPEKEWNHKFKFTRETHGLISYEMIMEKFPKLICYLPQSVKKLIALVGKHHQKKAPIDKLDYEKLKANNKQIHSDTIINIIEEDIELKKYVAAQKIDVRLLVSLIRVLDAADTQYSRSGSVWLTSLKNIRNDRMLEESQMMIRKFSECHTDFHKDMLDILNYRVNYYINQPNEYFKHSLIEKTWIAGGNIIIKPIDSKVYDMLVLNNPGKYENTNYSEQIDQNFKRVKEYIAEEFEYIQPYLDMQTERTIWKINEILKYEPKKHKNLVNKFDHYDNFIKIDRFINQNSFLKDIKIKGIDEKIIIPITSSENKVHIVVSPKKTGKTEILAAVCSKLVNNNNFDDICVLEINRDELVGPTDFINLFVTKTASFLSHNGNFLFLNQIRSQNEIEETQWKALFEQLEKGNYLICFDNFNFLGNRNVNSIEYRFMSEMFSSLKKTKFLIFTTKFPVFYFDINKTSHTFLRLSEIISNDNFEFILKKPKKYLGIEDKFFTEIIKNNETKFIKDEFINEFNKFADFLPFLIFELKNIFSNYNINSVDELNKYFKFGCALAQNNLKKILFEGLSDRKHTKVIKYILENHGTEFNADFEKLYESFSDEFEKNKFYEIKDDFIERSLMRPVSEKPGYWKIDSWWKLFL